MSVFYIRGVQQTSEQIAKLSQLDLFNINIQCMRKSFFKYYPNTFSRDNNGQERNYSIDALQNNTVYLSALAAFDDPYDCNIYIDGKEFALQRIH